MRADVAVAEVYDQDRTEKYRNYLFSISSRSVFEDDLWKCDKLRRNPSQRNDEVEIKFNFVPEEYKEKIKYFTVISLMSRQMVSTVKTKLGNLRPLYEYAYELGLKRLTDCSSYSFAIKYKQYLDENYPSKRARREKWLVAGVFFQIFDDCVKECPFCSTPYSYGGISRTREKYIPEYVLRSTDEVFTGEGIPVHVRLVYWLLRLIPSRISEVCGMEINCLNMFNGLYVVFIPSWKQNGGYKAAQVRSVYLKYEGVAGYLIDLIKMQQELSKSCQRYLPDDRKGLLLTYHRCHAKMKNPHHISMRTVKTVSKDFINSEFRRICLECGITDEDGNPYHFSTHQFRHTGITDRLEQGFTPEQIRLMTAHQGESMILNFYNHIYLKKDFLLNSQKVQLNEECPEKILFRGRILGMEEKQEQRILSNIRAQRVRGGICGDITGCGCDMLSCCGCEHFVADSNQKTYFVEQVNQWRMKLERFRAFPMVIDNAERNIKAYESLIDRIQRLTGGGNE